MGVSREDRMKMAVEVLAEDVPVIRATIGGSMLPAWAFHAALYRMVVEDEKLRGKVLRKARELREEPKDT